MYANTVVLLAELNLPELYTSMVGTLYASSHTAELIVLPRQVPLLVQTALQSDWLCRLVSHEVLHNVFASKDLPGFLVD